MATVRIQIRRGTAAQWNSANPTLAAGEVGLETDTRKIKFGDGSTVWSSLSYLNPGDIDELSQDAINAALTMGSGLSKSYNDGANTLTISLDTGVVATLSDVQTLTNKTINLTSNTLSGTVAQFNTALSDGDFATLAGTETLTNKTLTSPTINTPSGLVKGDVGLGNVDNTSDANKPVSTHTQTALDLKANLASPTFTGTVSGITKSMVGLGNVDNTSDANKPVSTATQTALDLKANQTDVNLKANLASPTFTGTVSAEDLTLSGNLTVNGTTTTVNSTTVSIDDKNFTLGDTASPSDAAADGGGITLKGTTDKTFNWIDSTDSWTSSEHINLASGKEYKINGTSLKDVSETLTNKTLTSPVISMGTNKITGLGSPTDSTDAANKTYVDNQIVSVGTEYLSNHAAVSTNVHGITNAANLVYTSDSRLSDTRTPTDATVSSTKIVDGAVTTAKIADSNITEQKLASNAVTTSKIADLNITTAKIADLNVTREKIAADAINSGKLADASVTTAKIADSNVTSVKIASDAIITEKIADANVTEAKINSGAVTVDKIGTGAVTEIKLADNSVTSAKIVDGTIVNGDISATAAIAQSKIADLTADLAAKANLASPSFTGTVTLPSTTSIGDVSSTEISYVNGVTSAIQTQLDAKAASADVSTHTSATTSVHGISDTSQLAYKNAANQTFTGNLEVDGNMTVDGNLTVNGTTFNASATSITIEDNIVQLAHQNAANTVDLGLIVAYTDGTAKHAGFVRDVSDSKWKLFKDVVDEPATTVNFGQGSLDNLALNNVEVAGVVFTDGTQSKEGVPSRTTIIQKSASYTLSDLAERDDLIEMGSSSALTLTIPANSSVAYPIGTSIDILQTGTGQVTIAGAGGVTVNGTPGLKLRTQWSSATLFKRASDTWVVMGDLSA